MGMRFPFLVPFFVVRKACIVPMFLGASLYVITFRLIQDINIVLINFSHWKYQNC